MLLDRALPRGGKIGTVGWKYWSAEEVGNPEHALEIPSLLADLLRARSDEVVNATALFMHPGTGLRSVVTVDDIARLEFANHMAAAAMRRMTFALREGRTDFDVVEAAGIGGLPLGCHVTFATGARPFGLSGPTGERIERGRMLSFNLCHWGANICRAGWLAEGPEDLPEDARDYLDAFVGPYLEAMNLWCGLMRPGVPGGAVQAAMDAALPGFGVTLNPGHLIGTDEWISSPIYPGSDLPDPVGHGDADGRDPRPSRLWLDPDGGRLCHRRRCPARRDRGAPSGRRRADRTSARLPARRVGLRAARDASAAGRYLRGRRTLPSGAAEAGRAQRLIQRLIRNRAKPSGPSPAGSIVTPGTLSA